MCQLMDSPEYWMNSLRELVLDYLPIRRLDFAPEYRSDELTLSARSRSLRQDIEDFKQGSTPMV